MLEQQSNELAVASDSSVVHISTKVGCRSAASAAANSG
jgi:hypothetical protein